jgi:hypothetical protein
VAGGLRLAREIAPERPRVALAAALVTAVHPSLVYAATHVQVALLATTLLMWTLALAFQLGRTGRGSATTGLLLGLLILTDPILGIAGVGVTWAIVSARRLVEAMRLLAWLAAVTAITLTPWTIRNYRVHGELVVVKSSFGYAFWQGNCKQSEGTDKVVRSSVERALSHANVSVDPRAVNASLWKARHEAGYLDDVVLTSDDYRTLGAVTEPQRSRILFRRALQDLRADPGRYLSLCLRRLRYFIFFDETNPKTRSLIYRTSHLGLTILATLGLALAAPDVRRRLRPTVATALLIAAFHSLTIVSARFHIPIEPLMAIWAACGLSRPSVRPRTVCRETPRERIHSIRIKPSREVLPAKATGPFVLISRDRSATCREEGPVFSKCGDGSIVPSG